MAIIKASGFIEEQLTSNAQKTKEDNWKMTFGNTKLVDHELEDPRKQKYQQQQPIPGPGMELSGFDIPDLASNDVKCENGQNDTTVPGRDTNQSEILILQFLKNKY